jgi:hypothetical protein
MVAADVAGAAARWIAAQIARRDRGIKIVRSILRRNCDM